MKRLWKRLGLFSLTWMLLMSAFMGNVMFAAGEVKLTGTATASTYDTRCTCDATQAVDGNLSTRWSGQGNGAWLKLDLGSSKTVAFVKMAFYDGASRTFTFNIETSTDNSTWTTRASNQKSALNNNLQTFDFSDVTARYVRIVGAGNTSNDWNSYTEVEAWGFNSGGSTDSKFAISGSSVTASTHDGNVPANTVDGNLTTRWSGQGDGAWIRYDLGSNKKVAYIKMAFHNGSSRTSTFDIQTSTNGTSWNTIRSGVTSAMNNNLQTFDFTDVDPARYVRLVGHGNTSNDWNSYTEVEIYGGSSSGGGGDTTAPTAPTGLAASAASSSQINLSWNASSDNVGVTGYDVYRGGSFLKSVTGTSTSDTGLSPSTTYSYTVRAKDAAGNQSSNSNTASATTQAGSGLCTTCPPSSNFNLTKWKITLPDASEVQNLTNYQHNSWFYTDSSTGGMVFVSPNLGGTTQNSSYTRSELREMLNASAGTKSLGNNWVTSTSSSTTKQQAGGVDGTMNATLRVDRVSTTGESGKVGRVVVGQIHGPDTEPIRLYYHKRPSDSKGAIYFGTDDLNNNNTWVNVIGGPSSLNPSNGIALGQKWSYEIKVVGLKMTVKVTPEGGSTTTVTYNLPSGYNDKYLYFKAGVYNQNNTGDSSDHVKATFFNLTHVHP
jgi:chitodextrinase